MNKPAPSDKGMAKLVSRDSTLGLYLSTKKPRFLLAFIFSLATFLVVIALLVDCFSAEEIAPKDALFFIKLGCGFMAASRLFQFDLRGFISLLVCLAGILFISQLA